MLIDELVSFCDEEYQNSECFPCSAKVIHFCAYRIIIFMRILVKAATHRRCGRALTNIPIEMDK